MIKNYKNVMIAEGYYENLYWQEQKTIDETTDIGNYLGRLPNELKQEIKKYCVKYANNKSCKDIREVQDILNNYDCIIKYVYSEIPDIKYTILIPEPNVYCIDVLEIFANNNYIMSIDSRFRIFVKNRRWQWKRHMRSIVETYRFRYPRLFAFTGGAMIGMTLALIANSIKK